MAGPTSTPSPDSGATDTLPTDASPRALSIARTIDRLCRAPGTYTVRITVPTHRRNRWVVVFAREEAFQRQEIGS